MKRSSRSNGSSNVNAPTRVRRIFPKTRNREWSVEAVEECSASFRVIPGPLINAAAGFRRCRTRVEPNIEVPSAMFQEPRSRLSRSIDY